MVPFMSRCVRFSFFFFVIPFLGLFVSLFTLWDRTLHSDGLQQPQVSSVQPASLRLCWVYVSAISVCFWTPILLLGHPGSFRSTHDLKCMRKQTGPRFHFPSERRGTKPTTWVPSTNIQPKPGFKLGAEQALLRYFPSEFCAFEIQLINVIDDVLTTMFYVKMLALSWPQFLSDLLEMWYMCSITQH